jgi:hypothetical protein
MKLDSNLAMKGRLTIAINDEIVRDIDNLVVNTGKNYVASRMAANGTAVMSHMAIGAGTSAALVTNPALGDQKAIVALATAGGSASNATVTYVATFGTNTPSSAAAITEAGIFNGASSGTMLCRTVFDVVNKQPSDSMTITWAVTAS